MSVTWWLRALRMAGELALVFALTLALGGVGEWWWGSRRGGIGGPWLM